MSRVKVDPAELANVWELERRYNAKLLFAEVWPNGHAMVELQPVADVGWYIDVWDRRARLVLVREEGGHVYADEVLELDPQMLHDLTTQVVCNDHGSSWDINRVYYPLSRESVELFHQLMAKARTKKNDR
ncbi:MAG: hypothetical protein D6791_13635 [Chloroflexi bacterium]|nr:MAG: hypothetical protein D6791_13635 [Chloroflexota bacterium]